MLSTSPPSSPPAVGGSHMHVTPPVAGPWWQFDRYGKGAAGGGALGRLEATIQQLQLLAIKAAKSSPPPAPPSKDVSEEEKLPDLVPQQVRPAGGMGIGGVKGRRRPGRIGETRLDIAPSDDEEDDEEELAGLSEQERQRRRLLKASIGRGLFDDVRPIVQLHPVLRTPGELLIQQEEKIYGRPNVHMVAESPPTDVLAVDPLSDGFHVPSLPRALGSIGNMDKLVARLVREDRQQEIWFTQQSGVGGVDESSGGGGGGAAAPMGGKVLKLEGEPLYEHPMRNLDVDTFQAAASDKASSLFRTRILPPLPYTGKEAWYDLYIRLHSLSFADHELMSREELLCRKLKDQVLEYKRRTTIDLLSHYEGRIHALRQQLAKQESAQRSWEESQANIEPDPHLWDSSMLLSMERSQLQTLDAIRESIERREREEFELKTLFKKLYETWMEIRTVRSDITRTMKARGLWNGELVPVGGGGVSGSGSGGAGIGVGVSVGVQPHSARQMGAAGTSNELAPRSSPPPSHPISPSPAAPQPSPPSVASPQVQTQTQQHYGQQPQQQPTSSSYPFPPPPLDIQSPTGTGMMMHTNQFISGPFTSSPAQGQNNPFNDAATATATGSGSGAGLLSDTLSSPTAAQQAATQFARERSQQAASFDEDDPFYSSPPPPNPPPPPPMPAPPTDGSPQGYDQQQQPPQQQPQYSQEQMAYWQQQQQQQQPQYPHEETKEPPAQQQYQPPPSSQSSTTRHITMQEALAQEKERQRMQYEQQRQQQQQQQQQYGSAMGENAPLLPSSSYGSAAASDMASFSSHPSGSLRSSQSHLLKDTYVGYPASFKVGRRQLDWKRNPSDREKLKLEKVAWNREIQCQIHEAHMRTRLQAAIEHGGLVPPNFLDAEADSDESTKQPDEALRLSIEQRMSTFRRRPGAPEYLPVFHEDFAKWFKDPSTCLPEEAERRRMIDNYKVYLRLVVNGQKVCETAKVALRFPSFDVVFDHSLQLALVGMPQSILVQVLHSRGVLALMDEVVGEVYLPVPEFGAPPSINHMQFSGKHIDAPIGMAAATGNMHMLSTQQQQQQQPSSRYTTATLTASVYWNHTPERARAQANEGTLGFHGPTSGPILTGGGSSSGVRAGPSSIARQKHRSSMRNRLAQLARNASSTAAEGAGAGAAGAQNLDPNDPRNAELLELMRRQRIDMAFGGGVGGAGADGTAGIAGGDGNVVQRPLFRASEFQKDLLLIPEEYFHASARRKVLAARNQSNLLREPVPLLDEDIPKHLYALISIEEHEEERKKEQMMAPPSKMATSGRDTGAIELDIEAASELAKWKEKAKILSISHEIYSVEEVVNEQPLPDLQVDLQLFDRLFERRRVLRPKRAAPKPIQAPNACNVVVQVIKGQNLPVRKMDGGGGARGGFGGSSSSSSSSSATTTRHVRTFIEVSLQDYSRRTSAVPGTAPKWDQILSLPFHPPAQSFSPAYLSQVTDVVYFNVFDEIAHVEGVDPRLHHTKVQRTEHRWLGSFSLPFTTIYLNGKIEGGFKVDVPICSIGYEKPRQDRDSFLFIYATLDPALALPPPQFDHFELHANPFYKRALEWVSELKKSSPAFARRAFTSVIGDIHGHPQFVCRYATPETPPLKLQRANLFTRFVSIIPFLPDAQVSEGAVQDIWCNSKEFLTLGAGDWEEHALLLHNYFAWYDLNVAEPSARYQNFVALGTGFPEGDTAYVLRLGVRSDLIESKLLFNAVTGECYDLNDPIQRQTCPMQSLACVFNSDNIWANIQVESDPTLISYELFNPKLWKPFFTPNNFTKEAAIQMYSMKFETIQRPIKYWEEPFEYYVDRANKIERLIERRFERWRQLHTHWDYGVCKILRDLLLSFEAHAQRDEPDLSMQMEKPLEAIKSAYGHMYGFPLHCSDSGDAKMLENSDENPVVKAVRNTKIHENEDTNAVFALAVYIHPYPNRLGSIWIYVASLTDK